MALSSKRIFDAIEQIARDGSVAAPRLIHSMLPLLAELRRRDRVDLVAERYAAGRALLGRHIESCNVRGVEPLRRAVQSLPETLDPAFDWRIMQRNIEMLGVMAAEFCILAPYPAPGDPDFDRAVSEILAWEATECLPAPDMPMAPPPLLPEISAETLAAAITTADGPFAGSELASFKRLNEGVSKATVLFDVKSAAGDQQRLVARIDSDLPVLDGSYPGMQLHYEYYLLRYLHRQGVKVATPIFFRGPENPLGREFFVSECLPGVARSDFTLSIGSISDQVMNAIARALAELHALPVDLNDPDLSRTHLAIKPPKTRAEANRNFVESLSRDQKKWGEPASPLIETAVRWLLENAPGEDLAPTIVHGDCGFNNIMLDGDEISGIIDWESARYGDPVEELGWVLFLTQGLVDPEAFLKAYCRAGGKRPSAFALRYMMVISRIKLIFVRDAVRPRYERLAHARPVLAIVSHVHDYRTMADLDAEIRAADAIK